MEIGINRSTGEVVDLPTSILRRHVAMLGANGSGKTVAAKVLIEEATLEGIPSIIVDPQGDLARFAQSGNSDKISEMGGSIERLQKWKDKAEVRIWTPGKSNGLQVCLNPFSPPRGEYKSSDDVQEAWDLMASGFTALAGHDTENPRSGKQVKSFLYELLIESGKLNCLPTDFESLADLVLNPKKLVEEGAEESKIEKLLTGYIKKSTREELSRTFNSFDSGVTKILFSEGVPLDIETLIEPAEEGKVPVNIFYLNSLGTEENRQSFVLELSRKINSWMLKQNAGKDEVRLLFFIDEVQKYLPPDNKQKPKPKDMLKLLFEQGRKFGVSCILATQSVSNVDYKTLGQAHTIFLGKFQLKQDISKIEDLLKESDDHDSNLVDELPNLLQGEFQISTLKEVSDGPIPIKTRWLYTEHGKIVTEEEVGHLTPDYLRDWANEKSLSQNSEDMQLTLPALVNGNKTGFSSASEPFESHLMGGLMLLKDPKDSLSVMLGVTNLLTAFVLLTTTFILGQAWIDGDNSGWLLLVGSLLSLMACVALVVETLLSDEKLLVQRIRKRARPMQYLILVWIWTLWFGNQADWFDLLWASILVDMAQTATTLFVVLEISHRLRLGRVQMQLDWNPMNMMKEAYHSLKLMLSESELAVMRATSRQVMQSLQSLTEMVTVLVLGLLIFDIGPSADSLWFDEITLRLFSIYALQIAARGYVFSQRNA
tara:strand:+ start:1445 stop:3577 length:2133 start_codon:yes stop_codon:yes gene_type:complete